MEKNSNSQLSFPQKYWWLLVIVACLVSPVAWHYIKSDFGNHSKQMIQIDNARSSDSLTNAPPDSLHH